MKIIERIKWFAIWGTMAVALGVACHMIGETDMTGVVFLGIFAIGSLFIREE